MQIGTIALLDKIFWHACANAVHNSRTIGLLGNRDVYFLLDLVRGI